MNNNNNNNNNNVNNNTQGHFIDVKQLTLVRLVLSNTRNLEFVNSFDFEEEYDLSYEEDQTPLYKSIKFKIVSAICITLLIVCVCLYIYFCHT